MEHKGLILCLQDHATVSYPETVEFKPTFSYLISA